jgi:hypothetical protein
MGGWCGKGGSEQRQRFQKSEMQVRWSVKKGGEHRLSKRENNAKSGQSKYQKHLQERRPKKKP